MFLVVKQVLFSPLGLKLIASEEEMLYSSFFLREFAWVIEFENKTNIILELEVQQRNQILDILFSPWIQPYLKKPPADLL